MFQLEGKRRGFILQMFKWVNLPKILDCHSSRSIINQRYENCLREGKNETCDNKRKFNIPGSLHRKSVSIIVQ
jgi:hypothetical protein